MELHPMGLWKLCQNSRFQDIVFWGFCRVGGGDVQSGLGGIEFENGSRTFFFVNNRGVQDFEHESGDFFLFFNKSRNNPQESGVGIQPWKHIVKFVQITV